MCHCELYGFKCGTCTKKEAKAKAKAAKAAAQMVAAETAKVVARERAQMVAQQQAQAVAEAEAARERARIVVQQQAQAAAEAAAAQERARVEAQLQAEAQAAAKKAAALHRPCVTCSGLSYCSFCTKCTLCTAAPLQNLNVSYGYGGYSKRLIRGVDVILQEKESDYSNPMYECYPRTSEVVLCKVFSPKCRACGNSSQYPVCKTPELQAYLAWVRTETDSAVAKAKAVPRYPELKAPLNSLRELVARIRAVNVTEEDNHRVLAAQGTEEFPLLWQEVYGGVSKLPEILNDFTSRVTKFVTAAQGLTDLQDLHGGARAGAGGGV